MESDGSEALDRESFNIEIELEFGRGNEVEAELIPKVEIDKRHMNTANEILLSCIINFLKECGYPLENSMIWYYSKTAELWIYCGNDPLPMNISVPQSELIDDVKVISNQLQLRCKRAICNEFGTVLTLGSTPSYRIKQEEEAISSNKTSRRTKERKIGFIIEKVSKWRNFYQGLPNTQGEPTSNKLTLEEAATRVGISKKSLDDYLLQLRFGRKFGFNFQEHREDKVGLLRAFVKKFKHLESLMQEIEMKGVAVSVEVQNKLKEPGTPSCKHSRCCAPKFALPYKDDHPYTTR
jgi:hypothetical protein